MADIEYLIKYDDTNGLQTEQHIIGIGTKDCVRFVTTEETQAHVEKGGRKVAIMRDPESKTPFGDLRDPYPVPVQSAKAQWIEVAHAGNGYHWLCGSVDRNDRNFERWEQRTPGPHSLPFPW